MLDWGLLGKDVFDFFFSIKHDLGDEHVLEALVRPRVINLFHAFICFKEVRECGLVVGFFTEELSGLQVDFALERRWAVDGVGIGSRRSECCFGLGLVLERLLDFGLYQTQLCDQQFIIELSTSASNIIKLF